ncbi:MAG: SH3 domain-containing protein [Chloroflexaceae bacterium]|nr:SH3 domain-containing protein [Chloroflexaceae bacterium]
MPTSTPTPVPQISVPAEEINVRMGPGTDYRIAGQIRAGETLTVLERNAASTWLHVQNENGDSAWVATDLVETQAPMETIPIAVGLPMPPPPIRGWTGEPVRSVCLDVQQSFSEYPFVSGVPPELSWDAFSLPIDDKARDVLETIDITVVQPGMACDAQLILVINGTANWASYDFPQERRICHTGADISGQFTLTAAETPVLTSYVTRHVPVPETILSNECYGNGTADRSPFRSVWVSLLSEGLGDLWGARVRSDAASQEDTPYLMQLLLHGEGNEKHIMLALTTANDHTATTGRMWLQWYVEESPWSGNDPVPIWIQAIQSPDEFIRQYGIDKLSRMGPEIIPTLIQFLGVEHKNTREAATDILVQRGPEVVPALVQVLPDENERRSEAAADVLKSFGFEAFPVLMMLIKHEHPMTRHLAAQGLVVITGEDLGQNPDVWQMWLTAQINERIDVLESSDPDIRQLRMAISDFRDIGSTAHSAVPKLIPYLDDERRVIRKATAEALQAITDEDFGMDADAWEAW